MSQLENSKSYCRNADLLSVEMDGDLVMMSIESGNYFGVSGIGPRIWELLESPRRFDALVESVVAEYEVDAETAASDLTTFLGKLEENGMIEVS
jgi:Coenzyme PQQ synthesis protein D (PqqD)